MQIVISSIQKAFLVFIWYVYKTGNENYSFFHFVPVFDSFWIYVYWRRNSNVKTMRKVLW